MDPHYTAQDVSRCNICETAVSHSLCDICHVYLCKPCIGEHISDEYDKHKIIPNQGRRSVIIYPKCKKHQYKNCKFQCKDCDNFVCSSCMASETHRGHRFVEMVEVYRTKKGSIEKDTEELENRIKPKYDKITSDLEKQIFDLDIEYENLLKAISNQGNELHREIDNVVNKMKNEICGMKVKHRDILKRHLDEVKLTQSRIRQTLHTLREIKESNDVSLTVKYNCKIKELSNLPPRTRVSLPRFTAKPLDGLKLCSFIGKISPLSFVTEEIVCSRKEPTYSVQKLLDKPCIIATIKTCYKKLRNVTCQNEDEIWTSGETAAMKCFNSKGLHLKTVQNQSGNPTNDISLDKNGNLTYIDRSTRTLNRVKKGLGEVIIRLQEWNPSNLCTTSFGDLLVVMFSDDETQSKVVCYSGNREKRTIQFDDEGKPLYSGNKKIKFITENRNLDICVSDCDAGAVVVVDYTGKLQFRYTGHPLTANEFPFNPFGITTDRQSHILTADIDNHRIHILDQKGTFLRYIDNCDLNYPFGLFVDKSDYLYVCEYERGNVKKINYSR